MLSTAGVILAALYLLWMYQRVIYGPVTKDVNKALPDLSRRELAILLPLAALILWMGLASPVFTQRIEPTIRHILILAHSPNLEVAGNVEEERPKVGP